MPGRGGAGVSVGAPPLQYEPIVTEGNEALVHHMEVFQCAAEFESVPHFSGPCDSKMKPERLNYCRHVLAAWALGAKVRAPPGVSPGELLVYAPEGAWGSPKSPLSPSPLCCWSPTALWSHRRLLTLPPLLASIVLVPRQVLLGLEGAVHRVVPGLAARAASRVFQQLLPAAQRWGLGGGLARG